MTHGTVGYDYLTSIETGGRALLALVADADLDLPVPACPGWTLREVVEHVAGASSWVSTCVSSGLTVQERILPPGPAGRTELLEWVRESLDDLLAVLAKRAPDDLVWTPIRGALGSVWWRRKAALEVAIHRVDVESALGVRPATIDPPLALAGIDEYAAEFLPLMLLMVTEPPPVTAVLLSPNDVDERRTLSLVPAGDDRDPGVASVVLEASASDLLLWMWNRVPDGTLTVRGDDTVVGWWRGLAI